MAEGLPNERSIFERRTIADIHQEIRDVYLQYPQPWVIGYSGGKDSTTVLQLIWNALEELPQAERQKPVFVIASDTKVETPVIVDYIDNTLHKILGKSNRTRLSGPNHAVSVVYRAPENRTSQSLHCRKSD
jgi:3'-phosphoadenosine 5'-phosphosulfate sulfotransferase (PAPS reductase)/FAD synthetase